MRLTFENALGKAEMSGGGESGIRITAVSGLGMPSYERRTLTSYDFDGAVESARKIPQRSIVVGGDIIGGTRKAQKLLKLLSEPCRMVVSCDSFEREIAVSACEAEFTEQNGVYTKFALALTCDDPYFYNAEPTQVGLYEKEKLITDETVLPAVFSIRKTSAKIDLCSDREIEATFVILGKRIPDETEGKIVIENLTTGAVFTLLYVPSDGEIITIDMAERTITSDINGNLIEYISDDSFLSDLVIAKDGAELTAIGYGATGDISAYIIYRNKFIEATV